MMYRIGINLGDVIVEDDRIYGDGVNIAARLEGLADPGGICISRTAFDQIEDKLPFGYEYLGEKAVKNISKPVSAYRVVLEQEQGSGKTRQREKTRRSDREKDASMEERRREKRIAWKKRQRARFLVHLRTYLIVIGFLFIINMITYGGVLWFYWPALGWGLALLLHWNFGGRAPSDRDKR
jgi:adenylate cyclase